MLQTTQNCIYNDIQCNEEHYLLTTPPCLVISLSQPNNNAILPIKIAYGETLDLSSVTLEKESFHKYKLISVIKEKINNVNNFGNNNQFEENIMQKKDINQQYITFVKKDNNLFYYEKNKKVDYTYNNLKGDFYPLLLIYVYDI